MPYRGQICGHKLIKGYPLLIVVEQVEDINRAQELEEIWRFTRHIHYCGINGLIYVDFRSYNLIQPLKKGGAEGAVFERELGVVW